MKIQNDTKSRSIEINVVDAQVEHFPSYQLKISLITEEYKISFNRMIWVEKWTLTEFISCLEKLEESRNGSCELLDVAGMDFALKFRNYDNFGHIAVELKMSQCSGPHDIFNDDLRIEFGFDSEMLLQIITDFKLLGNDYTTSPFQ